MESWRGASKAELIEKWGYPQSANDVVKFDDGVVVYTYRSISSAFSPVYPSQCVVSFTIKNDVVTAYKYRGHDCPRAER